MLKRVMVGTAVRMTLKEQCLLSPEVGGFHQLFSTESHFSSLFSCNHFHDFMHLTVHPPTVSRAFV